MITTNELRVGDLIPCGSGTKMAELMRLLESCGIETDYCYESEGIRGKWLEVISKGAGTIVMGTCCLCGGWLLPECNMSYKERGYTGKGIVHMGHCSKCGAEIEVREVC